jgi:hypothetical protein
MVLPSKLSRRTRNFGYRLGLRRRLEKEDVVCFLLFVVGSFLIFVFWKSNLQPDFNVSVCDRFDARSSAVLRELDESN